MTRIAVMQPYFFPYAGYFRLFASADTVVMFDCVQFPRRGWVHRNRFVTVHGQADWLTLPLAKANREVRISDLRFPPDVRSRLESAMRRFPVLDGALKKNHTLVQNVLDFHDDDAAAYICKTVGRVVQALGIATPIIRSSTMAIDPALRGQDRVLSIVKALGGTEYINPPGGRSLYDHATFSSSGVRLRFLTPYGGNTDSILSRLLMETPDAVLREIERETVLIE